MYLTHQRILSLAVFTAAVACSTSVFAHSDVLFGNVGGKVTLGTAEVGVSLDLFPAGTTGSFESIMIAGAGFGDPDYESDEPGFYSDPTELGANAVPAGLDVFVSTTPFTVDGDTAELFYWDGTGSVDFGLPAGTTSFEFEAVPGPEIGTTSAGIFDDHPEFILEDTSGVPADGVYLIAFEVDVDTLETSQNAFAVLLVDSLITSGLFAEEVEEALEALEEGAPNAEVDFGGGVIKDFAFYEEAVEFVEENYVPEPSTGLIALFALGFAAVSRNRRV